MIGARTALAGAFALTLVTRPALAGPCTEEISRVQAVVDARIEAIAGAGASAPESGAARLHRQPTPGSIAAAEQSLGEGKGEREALAALARARTADAAGDKAACDRALAEARQAFAR
jgi:hypothetical protein